MKIKCPLCDYENYFTGLEDEGNRFCSNCNEPLFKPVDFDMRYHPYFKNEDKKRNVLDSEHQSSGFRRNEINYDLKDTSEKENIKTNLDLIPGFTMSSALEISNLMGGNYTAVFKDLEHVYVKGYEETIKTYALFETMFFLIFEVDYSLYTFEQDIIVREYLIPYIIKKFVEITEPRESLEYIMKICNERLDEYNNLINTEHEDSLLKALYESLIYYVTTAIKNERLIYYKELKKPLVPAGAFETFPIKSSFLKYGYKYHLVLRISLKHLCRGSSNFLLLDKNEIDSKIDNATKEINKLFA